MYNKRVFLSEDKSDSTSSLVAYEGEVTYMDKLVEDRFLEIADCRSKIRLHQNTDDTKKSFIDKMKILQKEINLFINHLENNK